MKNKIKIGNLEIKRVSSGAIILKDQDFAFVEAMDNLTKQLRRIRGEWVR